MVETSVVVRSFNEDHIIGEALDGLAAQAYRDFEVVLVDSGSTDDTLEVAGPRADTVVQIDPRDFTFGYSLNAGCEAADGRFVAFLSAHAIPTDERWLGRLVEHLRTDGVAMAYSRQTGVESTAFAEQRHFEALFPPQFRYQTPPDYFANNASSAIVRELWEERHFDEYLTGLEDVDWAKHVMDRGYLVVYEPRACIYHVHDETPPEVRTRFEREAIAAREIGVRRRRERWAELARIPLDAARDLLAAWRRDELDAATAVETCRYRYHQRVGTARGLTADRDLDRDRYEYFYGGANRRVLVAEPGRASVERGPLSPVKPNDVLVGVEYAGVSPLDHAVFRGTADASYPVVPGREFAGRVLECGANVEGLAVDDRVVAEVAVHCGQCEPCRRENGDACRNPALVGVDGHHGGYAQHVVLPSECVHSLPADLSTRAAPLVVPLSGVHAGLERVAPHVDDGARAAVFGDGARATLAARLLADRGHAVTVYDDRGDHADSLPADARVVPEFPAGPVDAGLLVDATGASTPPALDAAAPGAGVVVLDGHRRREGTVAGAVPRDAVVVTVDDAAGDYEAALASAPTLDLEDLIEAVYPLDAYREAWTATVEGELLRAVLDVPG